MRDKIKLVSTANTGHYYTTTKNKRTMTEKMVIKKQRELETLMAVIARKNAESIEVHLMV